MAVLCVLAAVALAAAWWPSTAARQDLRRGDGSSVRRAPRRQPAVPRGRQLALVVAAAIVGTFLLATRPVVAGAFGCLVLAERRSARRRRRRQQRRRVEAALPDALDLFVVSLGAGLRPIECFELLAPLVGPTLERPWAHVLDRIRRGERFADAVVHLGDQLGPDALSFATTLAITDAAGLAIAPVVDRLADDARQQRRRAAEAAARELPVRLAFPLVLCTLPAFVLVAIVPLLLGALSSLHAT